MLWTTMQRIREIKSKMKPHQKEKKEFISRNKRKTPTWKNLIQTSVFKRKSGGGGGGINIQN